MTAVSSKPVKRLKLYPSMDPNSISIGWERDDVPLIHVFAQGAPGEQNVRVHNGRGEPHWPCAVCEAHGYTKEMFLEQLASVQLVGGLRASG